MSNDAAPILLLVADDLLMGSRVREGAKPSGFTVTVVGSEAAAKAALSGSPAPVAVLVALTVRRVDPFALIRFVKATYPAIPVLAFAGHVERELHEKARQSGADLVTANSSVAMHLPALLTRLLRGESGNITDEEPAPE
ncbi:MAG: response regulator [Armatimonadetes bacterium]|nr:response regulator [Armatimonadota bacterium]